MAQIPARDLDYVSGLCFDFGAAGVEEPLSFVQPDLTFDPTIVEKDHSDLKVYFENPPPVEFVETMKQKFPSVEIQTSEEQEKDWLAEWKKGFVPFRLTGPYWVVPSWLPVPTEAERPMFIDPGMAFGTGTHATTQIASEILRTAMREVGGNPTIADIGSGTGILAMMAKMEGARQVVANDIDPEARRVARENIEKNKLPGIQVVDESAKQIEGQFDIVVANIIDGVLLQIREDLLKLLRPGGRMVICGVLDINEARFEEGFLKVCGLRTLERIQKDEWVGYLLG